MSHTKKSTLVAFDGDEARAAVHEAAGDSLLSVTGFTSDDFEILYVADAVLDLYRDRDHLHEHYDQVLSHLHMDIMERDVYENTLLPNAGAVRAIVTYMEEMTLVRVIVDEQGLYVALAPDQSVRAVVEAVEPVLD
jgi:hypothetical protein